MKIHTITRTTRPIGTLFIIIKPIAIKIVTIVMMDLFVFFVIAFSFAKLSKCFL